MRLSVSIQTYRVDITDKAIRYLTGIFRVLVKEPGNNKGNSNAITVASYPVTFPAISMHTQEKNE